MKKTISLVLVMVVTVSMLLSAAACSKPAPTPSPKPPAVTTPASKPASPSAAPKPTAAPSPKPSAEVKHPIVTINFLTAAQGTGSLIWAFELSRQLEKKHPWLRATATATPGAIYDGKVVCEEPARRANTVFLGERAGLEEIRLEDPQKYKAVDDMQHIITSNSVGPVFFQTFNEKIKTSQDLVGKKIALGTKAQSIWAAVPVSQLRAWGILDKVRVDYLGTAAAGTALVEGAVDACVSAVYSGIGKEAKSSVTSVITDALATNKKLYYIAPTKEEAQKAQMKGWLVVSLAPGSIKYQETEIWGLAVPVEYIAHKDLPEEVGYELVKFVLANYKDFWPAHATFTSMTPATMPLTFDVPYHPGAARAYKEYAVANPNAEATSYYKEWGLLK